MAQKFTVPLTVKQLSSSGSDAITVFVDADTFARLKIEAGGRLTWGSGSGAGDVNLYRDGADVLKTDDTFKASALFVDGIEIDTTGATTDQVLAYNGTKFVPVTGGGGGGATNLDGLTDVVIVSPEEFQSLSYNGTSWVNGHIPVVSYVRNAESTTLTTGTAVYLFGSTGDHASVKRADNDSDTTSSKVLGLVAANIAASQNGPVVTRGYVDGIDLSVGYTAGDILWLGEDGGFTTTKPSAPEHLVFIGVVVRATNNGIIYVATQNGYELEELHDVDINTGTLASGDFLKYNGTLWVNDPINLGTDTVGDYVASLVAGNGITLSNNSGEGATPTINAGATVSDSTPSSPTTGQLWYESDTGGTFVYTGSLWVEVGQSSGMSLIDSQTFSSSTSYTLPGSAKIILVECICAGGGGGSGRRSTGSTAGGGGGGGGGGPYFRTSVAAAELSSPVTVTIGAGGAGGAARAATSDGLLGDAGGQSRFGTLYFPGGRAGAGGSTSTVTGGSGYNWSIGGTLIGGGGTGGTGTGNAGGRGFYAGAGGGGGGGRTSTTSSAGAAGGSTSTDPDAAWNSNGTGWTPLSGGGGTAGTASGGNGDAGDTAGFGGGGGGGNTTTAGGNGGNGATPGGGGGGGGGTIDSNSGAGGTGGNAQIKIWVFG